MTPLKHASALDMLHRLPRTATLGEIFVAVGRDNHVWDRASVIDRCDQLFAHRADYRLWRFIWPSTHSHDAAALKLALLQAERNLDGGDNVITWGLVSTLHVLITSDKYPLSKDDRLHIAHLIERRMSRGLPPIRDGEIESAAIRILAWTAADKARAEALGRPVNEGSGILAWAAAANDLDRLERLLSEAAPGWSLGKPVLLKTLQSRRDSQGVVKVAPFSTLELSRRLVRAMDWTQESARRSVTSLTNESEQVLDRAFLMAMSAWQTARLDRLAEDRKAKGSNPSYRRTSHYLLKTEFTALLSAAAAAKDAGNVLLSAGLAHLLLRLLPDELLKWPTFAKVGNRVALWIRQAGLEVDERFHRDRDENRRRANAFIDGAPSGTWPGTTAAWRARIAHDQEEGKWGEILAKYGGGGGDLRRVLMEAEQGKQLEPAVLSGAFSLYLRYGWIEEAYSLLLLDQFRPTKEELVDFVHGVKRALQVMPFGFDVAAIQRWHGVIRRTWSLVIKNDSPRVGEALAVHEILLGRASAVVLHSGTWGARLFAERFYSRLSSEEIRDMLDRRPLARRSGPAHATKGRVDSLVSSLENSSLGAPVFVSAVDCVDTWGILGVGAQGRWLYEQSRPNNLGPQELMTYVGSLKETSALWLRRFKNRRQTSPIPWGEQLTSFGKAILDLARRVDPSARWLMLAVEPELANLPWQSLFRTLGERGIVVSIVPSVTWATLQMREAETPSPSTLILSDAADLRILRDQIAADRTTWTKSDSSIACVLGHGIWSNGSTAVEVSNRSLTLTDWLDIATRRVVVAHSCFGGKVSERFSGDLGGLPGVSLAMGCRVFCSPVSSIPVETAAILHRHLFQMPGPQDFGSRYLAAIEEDERVGLYNLYGLANEATGPIRSNADKRRLSLTN